MSVYGGDSIGELGGEGAGVDPVEGLVKLLQPGNPEDHGIAMISVEDAVECRPSQRRGMSANPQSLCYFQNLGHGGLDGGFSIEGAIDLSDGVLEHLVSMVEET
ncbi:hypothetical protein SLS62_010809 [Diatrype stigma]|uniref:Uncharacterized protein n=1 Tax=Diatrype stigma TaxID=117547 RepID=A0AAN9U7M8_9PEZI